MAGTVVGRGSGRRMHLDRYGLLVQLDVGAGEGRGAGYMTVERLHHSNGGHPLAPRMPEVLLEEKAAELEDHRLLQNGQRFARRLDNVQHHEAARCLAEEVEPDELQRQHADQLEALDLRIQAAAQKARLIAALGKVVAAEDQAVAGEAYMVLAQSHALDVHQREGILHQHRLVDLLVFGEQNFLHSKHSRQRQRVGL